MTRATSVWAAGAVPLVCLLLGVPAWGQVPVPADAAETPGAERREDHGDGRYRVVSAPVKRVEAELSFDVRAPRLRATEWITAAPLMPDLPGQSNITCELSPAGEPARERSEERRPILLGRIAADRPELRDRLSIRALYRATLWSRRLDRRAPAASDPDVPPLSAEERRLYLASGGPFDFDAPETVRWLIAQHLRRNEREPEIDFARRVFLAIKNGCTYVYNETLDRHASRVCEDRKSDCGGLAILFVSSLRANGIPARTRVGRWALSSDKPPGKEPYHQQHVKAEFYAEGVGWVPVDCSSAVLYDKSPEGTGFFGNDDGDFLTLHVDGGLLVDTKRFGIQPFEILQGVAFWAAGGGDFEGLTTRESWRVKTGPLPELHETVLRKRMSPKKTRETKDSRSSP